MYGNDAVGGLSSSSGRGGGSATSDFEAVNATYIPWLITYWSTFLLAWTILPLTRQTLLSGHDLLIDRVRHGLRKVLRSHLIMLCLGAVAVSTLAVKIRTWNVLPVVMALGNTYGLLLVSPVLIPNPFLRSLPSPPIPSCGVGGLRTILCIVLGGPNISSPPIR